MEKKFTDYPIFEDEKMKVWFSNVDSFKVRVFRFYLSCWSCFTYLCCVLVVFG